MKKIHQLLALSLLVSVSALYSCSTPSRSRTTVTVTNQPTNLPPGQAKKIYGTQSAKPFAPGQQKKLF